MIDEQAFNHIHTPRLNERSEDYKISNKGSFKEVCSTNRNSYLINKEKRADYYTRKW